MVTIKELHLSGNAVCGSVTSDGDGDGDEDRRVRNYESTRNSDSHFKQPPDISLLLDGPGPGTVFLYIDTIITSTYRSP